MSFEAPGFVRLPLPPVLNCALATSQDKQQTVLTLRRMRLECLDQLLVLEARTCKHH